MKRDAQCTYSSIIGLVHVVEKQTEVFNRRLGCHLASLRARSSAVMALPEANHFRSVVLAYGKTVQRPRFLFWFTTWWLQRS